MKKLEIINSLLAGNRLSESEILEAKNLLKELQTALDSRVARNINFKRIDNDSNGNPRYVCHFLNLSSTYEDALKLAKKLGGRKFNNKQYGGGVVFQSYNLPNLEKRIKALYHSYKSFQFRNNNKLKTTFTANHF